jgi:hypothetical protein
VTEPTTIREVLQNVVTWHSGDASELGQRTVSEGLAGLALLDNGTHEHYPNLDPPGWYRLVPDPAPRVDSS